MKEVHHRIIGWIIKSPRRSKIFIILYKPMLYCDIKSALRLGRNDRVDELKELIGRKLMECKTPECKKGKLYGLTLYGKRVRKIFLEYLESLGERTKAMLMDELGVDKIEREYKESKEIKNWNIYAEIDVSKKQLRPLLEVLSVDKKGINQINSEFKTKSGRNWGIGNLHTRLALLGEMKVVEIKKEDRNVFYRITPEGITIKEQLHA